MKKTMSLLLAVVLLLAITPIASVSADASGTTGECTWTLADGHLTISGNGPMGDYSGNDTALWGTDILSVTIEDGVTHIGAGAFANCMQLETVDDLPDSVVSIGSSAFYLCVSLGTISFGRGIRVIGRGAFDACMGLEVVKIKDLAGWCNVDFESGGIDDVSLSNPLGYASYFYVNDVLVTDLVIPEGVTVIKRCAFEYGDFNSVTISDSVTTIENFAFMGCRSLHTVTIPASVTSIGSGAFIECTALVNLNVPDSVTCMGSHAFYFTGYYNDSANWSGEDLYIGNHLMDVRDTISDTYTVREGTVTISAYVGDMTTLILPRSVVYIGSSCFDSSYLTDVYYGGSRTDRNHIVIEMYNWGLENATWHYALGPSAVLGDVNGDGRTNNRDLGLLQQYLAGWEVTADADAADVNADGRVNNRDLGLLQQYLAGWDVSLG